MSMGSPQNYKPLHSVPVRPLATIMKQLRNDTREVGVKEIVDDISQIEDRFYSGRVSTPLDRNDCDVVITSLRPKMRLDSRERNVAQGFNRELKTILSKVPCDTWKFERDSDKRFNENMSVELGKVLDKTELLKKRWLDSLTPRSKKQEKRPQTIFTH